MRTSIRRAALALVVLLAGGGLLAQGGPDGKLTYNGFAANLTPIKSPAVRSAMARWMLEQIELIGAVTLKPDVREFFQSIPITVYEMSPPSLTNLMESPGLYLPNIEMRKLPDGRIERRDTGPGNIYLRQYTPPPNPNAPPVAPVLLHECLHAYHFLRLPMGYKNADVERLFKQANERGLVDPTLRDDVREYFAVLASIYLHGAAGRDPFTRENLKTKHPETYAWLEREFGPQSN